MGIINVLDIHVANLIAAGEVVDRPASAVKELIENSIDAGASKIAVEIKRGGVAFIRVCDNGKGMSREDVPVCIQRHATSKISTQWDLGKIMTLGFRGEALAAISSVAKVRIMTKRREDKTGTLMMCNPGEQVVLADTGCPDGTTVIVEELFANVPARRKFLKKDVTEGMAVSNVVEKLALSRPDIAFKFISDDNVKFSTAGDGKLANAIYALYGRDYVKKMTPVSWLTEGVKIYGYIGNPDNVKKTRNYQILFVNDRYVRNKTVSAAIEQAYDSYIPEGKFPCCVLKIEVHPAFVDANVHPTKAEVKFSDERQVFEAVYSTVRGVLERSVARPVRFDNEDDDLSEDIANRKKQEGLNIINSFLPIEEKEEKVKPEKMTFTDEMKIETAFPSLDERIVVPSAETPKEKEPIIDDTPISVPNIPSVSNIQVSSQAPVTKTQETDFSYLFEEKKSENNPIQQMVKQEEKSRLSLDDDKLRTAEEDKSEEVKLPFYKIIGEAFYSYIFVEMADKVLIIDKHAAHERIIFEELKSNMKKKKGGLQYLLVPVELQLGSLEKGTVDEYFDDISAIGFEMQKKANGDITLVAIPLGLDVDASVDLFMTVCDRLAEGTGSAELSRDIVFEKALYQASCKAAIKAGRPDSFEDTKAFVKKLMALPDIKYCPHGRPVAFEVTKDSLEKQFKRK
ncbi:MAG: DNA mismatch repair endonuclease MutL [Ruminococcaceae bacterium]|nr:DNA mismatch repair endonuclease MutL [Oscillospiraceae bacterium]